MSLPSPRPRPIPLKLWQTIQAVRSRLQAASFTGKLMIEFDVIQGQDRRVIVIAPEVAEADYPLTPRRK